MAMSSSSPSLNGSRVPGVGNTPSTASDVNHGEPEEQSLKVEQNSLVSLQPVRARLLVFVIMLCGLALIVAGNTWSESLMAIAGVLDDTHIRSFENPMKTSESQASFKTRETTDITLALKSSNQESKTISKIHQNQEKVQQPPVVDQPPNQPLRSLYHHGYDGLFYGDNNGYGYGYGGRGYYDRGGNYPRRGYHYYNSGKGYYNSGNGKGYYQDGKGYYQSGKGGKKGNRNKGLGYYDFGKGERNGGGFDFDNSGGFFGQRARRPRPPQSSAPVVAPAATTAPAASVAPATT